MVLQPEHRFVQSERVPILAHFADEHSIIGRCRTRKPTSQFLGIAIRVQHQERAHLMQVQELIVITGHLRRDVFDLCVLLCRSTDKYADQIRHFLVEVHFFRRAVVEWIRTLIVTQREAASREDAERKPARKRFTEAQPWIERRNNAPGSDRP
jgi:hypothetical protein